MRTGKSNSIPPGPGSSPPSLPNSLNPPESPEQARSLATGGCVCSFIVDPHRRSSTRLLVICLFLAQLPSSSRSCPVSFVHSSIHPSVHPFHRSFVRSFASRRRDLVHSFAHSLVRPSVRPSVRPPVPLASARRLFQFAFLFLRQRTGWRRCWCCC